MNNQTQPELALACCSLALGFETLLYNIRYFWFTSDEDLPEWVLEHHGMVEAACLEIEKKAAWRVRGAATRMRESIRNAVSATPDLYDRVRPDIREFFERSEPGCLPRSWFIENSIFQMSPWPSVFHTESAFLKQLPKGFLCCHQLGKYMARIERLWLSTCDSDANDTEQYPVESFRAALLDLPRHFKHLGDIPDIPTTHLARAKVYEVRASCRQAYQHVQGQFSDHRRKPRVSCEDANVKVRELLRRKPNATQRELAELVGCAASTVGNTPAWKAVSAKRKSGAKPRAERFSKKLEDSIGVHDKTIESLTKEQESEDKSYKAHPSA